ncbi:MAG: hypothetical protein HW407_1955 [Bacteroidetes bacterium]|nr:hypothetical protein [Bacteroidota bacterium]
MKTHSTLLFIVLGVSTALTQNLGQTFQIAPYVGLYDYTWKEFDDNGSEALKESGSRFSFGAVPRYSFLRAKDLYAEMDLQFTSGTVEYTGFVMDLQTGARTPFTTKTAYFNFEVTASAGYIVELTKSFQLTPVAGFGFELWNRDIANGGPNGYDEKYSVALANIGVNGTYILNHNIQVYSGILLKFPLSISESIDRLPRVGTQVSDINLSPGSNPRFAIQVGGSVYQVFAVLYFETWTLSKSPDVKGLHQPESTRKFFGLKVGYTIEVI